MQGCQRWWICSKKRTKRDKKNQTSSANVNLACPRQSTDLDWYVVNLGNILLWLLVLLLKKINQNSGFGRGFCKVLKEKLKKNAGKQKWFKAFTKHAENYWFWLTLVSTARFWLRGINTGFWNRNIFPGNLLFSELAMKHRATVSNVPREHKNTLDNIFYCKILPFKCSSLQWALCLPRNKRHKEHRFCLVQ